MTIRIYPKNALEWSSSFSRKVMMLPVVAALLCSGTSFARAQQATRPESAPIPPVTTPDLIPERLPPIASTQTSSAPTASITGFSSFDFAYLFNVFPGREYKATSYQETAGLNITLNPNVTFGVGLNYNHSHSRLLYLENGRSRSEGPGAFVTASLNVNNLFTVGGALQYVTTDNSSFRTIQGLPSAAKYDSETFAGTVYVSKYIPINEIFFINPQLRLQYSESRAKPYLESTGIFNPRSTSILGRLSVGSQLGVALSAADWSIAPNVEAFFLYDYHLPLYQADRTGFEVRPGIFASKNNIFRDNDNLSLGASFVTILGRRDYRTFDGGRGFLAYKF